MRENRRYGIAKLSTDLFDFLYWLLMQALIRELFKGDK